MAKAVTKVVKIQITAGKANPAPPVGTALGPCGIDIQKFCAQFNEETRDKGDIVIPAEITIYEDRSFSFKLKTPPAAVLVKKALNLKSGSGVPQKDKVGHITRAQLEAIATEKMQDLNANDLSAAVEIIKGTCRSMGVTWDKT